MTSEPYQTVGEVHGVLVTVSPSHSYYGRGATGPTRFLIAFKPTFDPLNTVGQFGWHVVPRNQNTQGPPPQFTKDALMGSLGRLAAPWPHNTVAKDLGINEPQLKEILDFCTAHHNMMS